MGPMGHDEVQILSVADIPSFSRGKSTDGERPSEPRGFLGGAEPERERERAIFFSESGGDGGGGDLAGETFLFRGERGRFFAVEGEGERDRDRDEEEEREDREDREREEEVDLPLLFFLFFVFFFRRFFDFSFRRFGNFGPTIGGDEKGEHLS